MYTKKILFVVFAMLFMASCASSKKTSSTKGKGGVYQEDLSVVRPSVPSVETDKKEDKKDIPPPSNTVNQQLETVLASISEKNKQIQYAQGYRIQVYSGNDRTLANQVKDKIYTNYPGVNVYMNYNHPSFRIKVGDFTERLEALKLYAKLKNEFPIALIVQEQINIQKKVE